MENLKDYGFCYIKDMSLEEQVEVLHKRLDDLEDVMQELVETFKELIDG